MNSQLQISIKGFSVKYPIISPQPTRPDNGQLGPILGLHNGDHVLGWACWENLREMQWEWEKFGELRTLLLEMEREILGLDQLST